MSENNIIIRIQGESDLSNAQAQIKELTARNKELEAQMKAVSKAEQEDAESIKQLGLQGEKLAAALKKNADYYRQQKAEVEKGTLANEKSIASLKQSVRAYNAINGAGVQTRQQLIAIREEMVKMAEAGDTTSARFIAMADKAGQLSDTVGDAQQVISLLASDTRNLDAAMQVGGGLVGAFNAATSAAALLGGESEKLQQAFLKVQAAMAVLSGVQQLMTVLDKRSAANVVIRTALLKLLNRERIQEATTTSAAAAATTTHAGTMTADAAATTAATAATNKFTAALLKNPVMLIVAALAALVAGITVYINKTKEATKAQKDYNAELERTEWNTSRMRARWEHEARMAEIEGKDWKEVHQIRKEGIESELKQWQDRQRNMIRIKNDKELLNQEWTQEEEDTLKEMNKIIESYHLKRRDLQWEFEEKQAMERVEAARKEQEELEAALKERQEALIQAAKDEAEVKRLLNNLNPDSQTYIDEDGTIWTKRELAVLGYKKALDEANKSLKDLNEEEEDVSIARYESIVELTAKNMELQGKSEQEIWDYKYNRMTKYIELQKNALQTRLGDEAQFSQEMIDLDNQLADLRIENARRTTDAIGETVTESLYTIQDVANAVMQFAGDMASEIFGFVSDGISQQIDELDEMYTTDAQEAKENANKKYISEKELQDKKKALHRKQAAIEKANAIFQIALNTAAAIMQAIAQFGPPPSPMGIAGIAMATALGATQLGLVAAKPLPAYAKGRKSGKGEYALVGERGPEVMYIPAGASIVPNNLISDTSQWGKFGVPAMPYIDNVALLTQLSAMGIDYEKLGKVFANNMPKSAINVNIDRTGVTVQQGNDTHTYMNTKYAGIWN